MDCNTFQHHVSITLFRMLHFAYVAKEQMLHNLSLQHWQHWQHCFLATVVIFLLYSPFLLHSRAGCTKLHVPM